MSLWDTITDDPLDVLRSASYFASIPTSPAVTVHEVERGQQAGERNSAAASVRSDAADHWDGDRAALSAEWSPLTSQFRDFQGTFDGAPIPRDLFEVMTHREMYDQVLKVDSIAINTFADGWRRITKLLEDSVIGFGTGVRSSMDQGWRGQSADAALTGTADYLTSAEHLQVTTQMTAHAMDVAEGHLAQAKASVPEPTELSLTDRIVGHIPGNGVLKLAKYHADEAEAQARAELIGRYRPGIENVSAQTPDLAAGVDPTGSTGGAESGAGPGGSGSGGGGAGGSRTGDRGSGGWADTFGAPSGGGTAAGRSGTGGSGVDGDGFDGTAADGSGAGPNGDGTGNGATDGSGSDSAASDRAGAGAQDVGATQDGGGTTGGGAPSGRDALAGSDLLPTDPSATTPASADGRGLPSAATTPDGRIGHGAADRPSGVLSDPLGRRTGADSGALGGGPPFGAGGGRTGAGSGGLAGPPSLGGAGVTGTAGASGGGAGSAGRAGTPGMGAMMPPGGRGNRDDDNEHRTPGYLVTVDNGNEVIGDLPKVAPPVIGA